MPEADGEGEKKEGAEVFHKVLVLIYKDTKDDWIPTFSVHVFALKRG